MRKLTTGLLTTYKTINNKYYAAKKARQAAAAAAGSTAAAATTGSSDYTMTVGDLLGGRYRVTESAFRGLARHALHTPPQPAPNVLTRSPPHTYTYS